MMNILRKGESMTDIVIILPAYNEELTIAGTIESFYQVMPEARIVVVNNNSTDETVSIALDTLSRLEAHGEVIHEVRQGKGNAVRRAFTDIEADIYVMCDADMTYPAERVHDMIAPVLNGQADMVIGDRLSKGHYREENKRKFHDFGNHLVKWLINKLFRTDLADIMSGYRVFSRKFVKNYPVLVEGFQIETDVTLHALDKRFALIEIPVEYKDRPEGSFSKLNTFSDGARVLLTITKIMRHFKPLLFFGAFACLFGALGLLASWPVFSDWIREQYIYHVPMAVLAVALELLAMIFVSIGLTLDSISHQHKMDFEWRLLNYKERDL